MDNFSRHTQGTRLLLEIGEVAEALHVGRSTVYSLIASGDLRPLKLGRLTRIPKGDVEALIAVRIEATKAISWPFRPGMP